MFYNYNFSAVDEQEYILKLDISLKFNRQNIKQALKNLLHIQYISNELCYSCEEVEEIINLVKQQIENIKNNNDKENTDYYVLARNRIFSLANKENLIKSTEGFKIFILDKFENFNSDFFELYIESDPDIKPGLHEEFKNAFKELTGNSVHCEFKLSSTQ